HSGCNIVHASILVRLSLSGTSCPLDITPPRVVVRFGDSLSANCTSSSDQIEGMGWESLYGGVDLTEGVSSLLFKIDSVPAWEIVPMCYMNSRDGGQCGKTLPVIVYKMPDSVSLKNLRTVEEGQQFAIQCDISLSVVWHKGNKILSSQTFDESSPSPVSKSSVLTLTAHRDDDGAEIWCEAKLNLWTEEQGPPPVRSEAHNVNVLYPPTFTNDPNENLEMTVRMWYRSHDVNHPILTPLSKFPGVYICTASNSQGIVTKYFIVTEAPRKFLAVHSFIFLIALLSYFL
uniref:Intercellular adhesion molecule N-terminal domain-containing protein n=1 Tax=Neolamprologus brichardi TaxID=32507 RepID=A0A3Q4GNB8_NEOBR